MSVTHRKKFSMNDVDVSSLPFSEDVFFQKFEGLAKLAQTVYKTKTEKLHNFPCTMYLAGKSLAVEQLLKMGFYGFCGGVYGIKVEKEEFGENAREFLGVPNLVFKILKNDKSADISFLCSTRKDRQELFELAEIGKPISISSLCTVFAESEVINYMGEGRSREDLAAGVIDSVALKVATLVQRKELQDTVIITGGFSNNEFFASLLSKKLGKTALAMPDGRYAGAYGAALLARERAAKD
jgi:hypothetical protein